MCHLEQSDRDACRWYMHANKYFVQVVRESGMCLRRMRERYKKERRWRRGERGGDAEEGTGHATTGRLVARGGDKRANTISPRLLHT